MIIKRRSYHHITQTVDTSWTFKITLYHYLCSYRGANSLFFFKYRVSTQNGVKTKTGKETEMVIKNLKRGTLIHPSRPIIYSLPTARDKTVNTL